MQYAHLGRSGVLVSRLCLGTMNFGWETNETDAIQIMDAALDSGINFMDTANAYGFSDKIGEDLTEKIIGKWLSLGHRRDKIVLTTKVFVPMGIGPIDGGLSAYHIRQSVEGSLKRLQTDHIDVLYMHHIDRGESLPSLVEQYGYPKLHVFRPAHLKHNTRWEEIWQAMALLVQQGKIIYVASSNFAGWNIAQACETADARWFLGLVAEQSQYNLTSRIPELEVIPVCREYELGLVPYSPLSNGILAGGTQDARQGRRADMKAKAKTLADKLALYFDLRKNRHRTSRGCCGVAAAQSCGHCTHHWAAHSSNSLIACMRWTLNWMKPQWPNWTKFGRGPGAKRLRRMRGKRGDPKGDL